MSTEMLATVDAILNAGVNCHAWFNFFVSSLIHHFLLFLNVGVKGHVSVTSFQGHLFVDPLAEFKKFRGWLANFRG